MDSWFSNCSTTSNAAYGYFSFKWMPRRIILYYCSHPYWKVYALNLSTEQQKDMKLLTVLTFATSLFIQWDCASQDLHPLPPSKLPSIPGDHSYFNIGPLLNSASNNHQISRYQYDPLYDKQNKAYKSKACLWSHYVEREHKEVLSKQTKSLCPSHALWKGLVHEPSPYRLQQ